MIKLLVLLSSLSIIVQAEPFIKGNSIEDVEDDSSLEFSFPRTEDVETYQELLLNGVDDDDTMISDSSNETSDQCEMELLDSKICLYNVWENLNIESEARSYLLNQTAMLSIIENFQNASCFGSTTNCTNVNVGKNIYDRFMYIGEKVYGYGFNCISKEFPTIENKAKQCANLVILGGEIKEPTLEEFYHGLKLLSDCIISRMDCLDTEKSALTAAAYKLISLIDDFMHPANILSEVGAFKSDMSTEELTEILAFFASIF